jgi:predicted nucleotidyltransferase
MDENAVEVANARFEILRSRLRQLLPDAEVILFGSRARGDAWDSSDSDLLIIVGDQFSVSEKRKLASAIQNDLAASGIDADILVRSNVEVDVAKRRIGSVVHEAFKEGLRL